MSITGSGNARPFISGENFKFEIYGKEGVRQIFIDDHGQLKIEAVSAQYRAKDSLVHANSIQEVVAQLCDTFGAEEAERLVYTAFKQTRSLGGKPTPPTLLINELGQPALTFILDKTDKVTLKGYKPVSQHSFIKVTLYKNGADEATSDYLLRYAQQCISRYGERVSFSVE